MNITFVLGNGFDIQLGLLSRYSDFLQEYIHITPDDNDNIMGFKNYLAQKATRELWSDAEKAMGVHLGQYSDATIENFNQRVQDFESSMVEYLKRQQERCSYSDEEQIETCFTDFLFNSFSDVLTYRRNDLYSIENDHNTFHFVTFNYTNLLERIIMCCISPGSTIIRKHTVQGTTFYDSWGSIIHVHGALNSKIIMGVNDEGQLDLSGGTTLTEALRWELIKPVLNRDYGSNFDLPAKNVIAKSGIIAIYGVSYGDTDKLWWEEITNWLRQTSEHKLVAFIRDKPEPFNPTIAWDELKYSKEKQREILTKLHIDKNSPDFEDLTKQIYIILNTTRLNLKEFLIPETSDEDTVAASTNPSEPTTI